MDVKPRSIGEACSSNPKWYVTKVNSYLSTVSVLSKNSMLCWSGIITA